MMMMIVLHNLVRN